MRSAGKLSCHSARRGADSDTPLVHPSGSSMRGGVPPFVTRGMTEFGRSSHARKHKFKESAYFCLRQMPRPEVRIERKMLLRSIREDLDQFAAFQQRIKTEGEALRDAVPSRAGIELGG
jgi:hypothetical protein